ncbi:hypothetical protein WCE41_11495 [Luteimonas sp. MJ246]|uniref:hypothetical protein n=1 Tax=Luteimonas sp. MJ174 TaxID=3129237 RepID=UPI0031BA5A81
MITVIAGLMHLVIWGSSMPPPSRSATSPETAATGGRRGHSQRIDTFSMRITLHLGGGIVTGHLIG